MIVLDTTTLDERASSLSASELYWLYNALDVCVTFDVLNTLEAQADETALNTYRTSMATLAPVMEMMLEGLPVSLPQRDKTITLFEDQQRQLEDQFQRLCVEGLGLSPDRAKRKGRRPLAINPASPKDVQFLLHDVLKVPEKKRKRKGAKIATTITDRATLEGFRTYLHAEPFINHILALRDAGKDLGFLRTTLDPDHKIRCSLNVAGTNTGRLSSSFSDTGSGTNLQNVRGRLKDIFVADPGWLIMDVDLGQGDSRGVAAIAWNWFVESHGEAYAGTYLDACEGEDLHTAVSRMVWPDLPWGDDPAKWRSVAETPIYREHSYRFLAKGAGHGSNYGAQPQTVATQAHVSVGEAEDFQRAYFAAFPVIRDWQQETLRQLEETRQLTTLWGRRRYFWGDPQASDVRNAAIAYSPQSNTGEFINRGMLQLWHYRNRLDLPIRFLLQVHDSLVLMVKESEAETLVPKIMSKLKVVLPLARGREFTIPLDAKIGWNYGGYHPDRNPHGLVGIDKHFTLDRQPPRKVSGAKHIRNLLTSPLNQL